MADELTYRANIALSKGGVEFSKALAQQSIDVTGDHMIWATQEIATSAENIQKGEITTVGFAMFHNTDATNYVEIGYDDTGFKPLIKLLAGEWCGPVRLSQSTPQAQANSAAVDLEYIIVEA